MKYVTGYVAPVPNDKKDAYIKFAKKWAEFLKKNGALSVVENWGYDVPEGKITSFPISVKLNKKETVVFSWVTWASKEAKDAAWEKVHNDEGLKADMENMPFDGERMIFGEFETIINL